MTEIVLALRLRISGNPFSVHPRLPLHCHHSEEGYVCLEHHTCGLEKLTFHKAKHLEPLKGGKIPLEILVRGKDAAANEKIFEKINDHIKSAGVSHRSSHVVDKAADQTLLIEESRDLAER